MRNHNEEPVGIDGNQIFGVVRFRDADDTYCFVSPTNTFFSVCNMYCETVKDHVGEYTLDSLGDGWWERDVIPESVFNVLCEAQPYSDQVAVVADFDFENDCVSYCDTRDGEYKTFRLEDIEDAVATAQSPTNHHINDRFEAFRDYLSDKEIDPESIVPPIQI